MEPTKAFAFNFIDSAKANDAFRYVIFTSAYSQHTLMAVKDSIPREKHEYSDQTIMVVEGSVKVIVNDTTQYHLTANQVIIVPANTYHEVINTTPNGKAVKIYTIYTPPMHPAHEYLETRPLND